ncbi:MAG: hypothetical protein K2J58_03335 [Muribaculaceae bacterium]|nr:hypothetical protein [Muribaculaceae bacterium]
MEFNYFKTSVMSVMAVGALAFSSSMMAAAPVSVLPAEGPQETLEDFTLIFNEGDVVAWNVSGTENAPYLTRNGQRIATVGTPNALDAVGNTLSINTGDEYYRAGEYQLNVAQGSYTVNGQPGDACKFTWNVSGVLIGYSVEPATSVVTEIQNIRITFNDNDAVTLTDDWGTDHGAILYLETETGLERRGTLFPSVAGNTLLLTMNSPIFDPGEYVVEVSPNCVLLDGKHYDQTISIHYTVVEPTYPEIDLSVFPATDVVETLDKIEVTFGGIDTVEWAVTGTENAPYMVNENGVRMATFSVLGGQGNMLSMSFLDEFTKKGNYTIVIPEGSYVLQGIYHGMAGKEIKLNYEVLGLGGYSVEPAANVLSELQFVKITFNDADAVTLADDLGTDNTPYIDYVNEEGERARRATLFPEVAGNTLYLRTLNEPIYAPGEYVVVVPGSTYFLDGNEGENIELLYTIVEPSYPEIDLSVNPATDVVETLDTIELTFGGVDIVEWAVTGTENAPYMEDENGVRMATFSVLGGQGNMLSMSFLDEFTKKGNYTIVIPAGSYVLQGIYHGMAGKEIKLNYEVLGLGGISIEPAVDIVSELQYVKVTFNDAAVVTIADDLGTTNSPYIDIIKADGARERRATLFTEATGNTLYVRTMYAPIDEPGEYVVVIPGSTYFVDGNAGEDLEFFFTVIGDGKIKYSVDPVEGVVSELHTFAVTFTDEAQEIAFWNIEALKAGEVDYPYITTGNGTKTDLKDVYAQEKTLYFAPDTYEAWTANGYYVVTIPAGSYYIDGVEGPEIVLNYIIEKTAVDAIFGEKANMDVYDLNGRVVLRGADANSVKSLRGIFVIDGKKYILR